MNPQEISFKPGTTISNRYEYLAPLGSGGLGTVLLVKCTETDQRFALKYLTHKHQDRYLPDPLLHYEFLNLQSLNHPNVVRVNSVDHDKHLGTYLLMEFVEGKPIDTFFSDMNRSPTVLYNLFHQILLALSYIHNAGILHGDIKPGNILVTQENAQSRFSVKITDFGLVTSLREDSTYWSTSSVLRGSAPFMPPEMLLGRNLDVRADIYSLGVTIYQLITNRLPYEGKDLRDLLLNPWATRRR